MIEIDGSQYSGSGTIVRQAVAFSALTGQPVHIINARRGRPKPGLRHQHITVIQAIRELVNGTADGLTSGSQEVLFRPGVLKTGRQYMWDIGTAGSTTMLALAILPVLAFSSSPVKVELRGGLFQDYAPSVFHLEYIILQVLRRMGLQVELVMVRPGYVPKGDGILQLTVKSSQRPLQSLSLEQAGSIKRLWGIALSSHLEERKVSERMAQAATAVLEEAGYHPEIELRHDRDSHQPGAALGLFANLGNGVRLGADRAGTLRRSAESIGKHVAKQLLEDLKTGATLDRFAADQIVPFAALAGGESRFRVPAITEHVLTNAWLAERFLGAQIKVENHSLSITGVQFRGQSGHA